MVVMYQCESFEFSGYNVSYVENVFVYKKCTLESLKVRISCQQVLRKKCSLYYTCKNSVSIRLKNK